jgi:hypothetical protein
MKVSMSQVLILVMIVFGVGVIAVKLQHYGHADKMALDTYVTNSTFLSETGRDDCLMAVKRFYPQSQMQDLGLGEFTSDGSKYSNFKWKKDEGIFKAVECKHELDVGVIRLAIDGKVLIPVQP